MNSSRKVSKAEKSLILVCGFLVLPLAGVVYLYGGRDAEPNWNIPAAATRPNPNGYDFFVAAARSRVYFSPPVDPLSDSSGHPPDSPYALKNYSLVRRQQWLQANAKTFALISKGLNTPSMAPDYTGGANKEWAHLRELARAISVRTRTWQIQNQPMRATMSALDGIQMGQGATRRGGVIARLVGIGIISLSREPLGLEQDYQRA